MAKKITMDDIRLYMDEDAELLEANCHAIVDILWNECERLCGVLAEINEMDSLDAIWHRVSLALEGDNV